MSIINVLLFNVFKINATSVIKLNRLILMTDLMTYD